MAPHYFADTSATRPSSPREITAEVLQTNLAMLNLARRLSNIEIRTEDGSHHVTWLFAW
jgi:hypothetical protein